MEDILNLENISMTFKCDLIFSHFLLWYSTLFLINAILLSILCIASIFVAFLDPHYWFKLFLYSN